MYICESLQTEIMGSQITHVVDFEGPLLDDQIFEGPLLDHVVFEGLTVILPRL